MKKLNENIPTLKKSKINQKHTIKVGKNKKKAANG